MGSSNEYLREIAVDLPSYKIFFKSDTGNKTYDLSTEYQTFTTTFTMNDTSNQNGAILFEFGDVEGSIGTENLITTVYIDNVVINKIN